METISVVFRDALPVAAFWQIENAAAYLQRTRHSTRRMTTLTQIDVDIVPWEDSLVAELNGTVWTFEGKATCDQAAAVRFIVPLT